MPEASTATALLLLRPDAILVGELAYAPPV
jgi:hypothetical protein